MTGNGNAETQVTGQEQLTDENDGFFEASNVEDDVQDDGADTNAEGGEQQPEKKEEEQETPEAKAAREEREDTKRRLKALEDGRAEAMGHSATMFKALSALEGELEAEGIWTKDEIREKIAKATGKSRADVDSILANEPVVDAHEARLKTVTKDLIERQAFYQELIGPDAAERIEAMDWAIKVDAKEKEKFFSQPDASITAYLFKRGGELLEKFRAGKDGSVLESIGAKDARIAELEAEIASLKDGKKPATPSTTSSQTKKAPLDGNSGLMAARAAPSNPRAAHIQRLAG